MKTPPESPDSLEISIHYDHSRDAAHGGALSMNLQDLIWSLDVNCRRHHEGSCKGEFKPGLVKLSAHRTPPEFITAILDAFRKAMAKKGFRLMFSYANLSLFSQRGEA